MWPTCTNARIHILWPTRVLPPTTSTATHAVCYDCVCLMPLIQITMFLFSDGDETANRTGYDRDYHSSPAGLLGCLPRRLCWLWVVDGMTQCEAKINGPYLDIFPHMIMNDGGRWDVRISITPPGTAPLWAVWRPSLIGCAL